MNVHSLTERPTFGGGGRRGEIGAPMLRSFHRCISRSRRRARARGTRATQSRNEEAAMRSIWNWLILSPLLVVASCVAAPAEPEDVGAAEMQACALPHTSGGGQYNLNGLAVHFAFNALQRPDGSAIGQFH